MAPRSEIVLFVLSLLEALPVYRRHIDIRLGAKSTTDSLGITGLFQEVAPFVFYLGEALAITKLRIYKWVRAGLFSERLIVLFDVVHVVWSLANAHIWALIRLRIETHTHTQPTDTSTRIVCFDFSGRRDMHINCECVPPVVRQSIYPMYTLSKNVRTFL